jgi:hypothetical protein
MRDRGLHSMGDLLDGKYRTLFRALSIERTTLMNEERYIVLPSLANRTKFDVIDSHTTIPVMVGMSSRTATKLVNELNHPKL